MSSGFCLKFVSFLKTPQWSQRRRLGCVLALNLAMIVGLVIAGLSAHSLGVLAAAGDFAADSVALILGAVAATHVGHLCRPAAPS